MLSIKSVIGALRNSTGELVEINHNDIIIRDLSVTHASIYIYLETVDGRVYGLDYDALTSEVLVRNITLTEWAATTGTTPYPYDFPALVPTIHSVTYSNLWDLIEDVELGNVKYHNATELLEGQYHDAWITSKTDISKLVSNGLFTAAGVIHKVDNNSERGVILSAGKTLTKSECSSLGYIDFSALGGFKIIDFTDDNMSHRGGLNTLVHGTYVDLKTELDGHTPYLILAGKLITTGELMRVVGERTVKLNLSTVDLVSMYHELAIKSDIDLEVTKLDGMVNNDSLSKDVFIRSLLQSDYSFIILVKSDNHVVGTSRLPDSKLPGVFTRVKPEVPILFGTGYIANSVVDIVDTLGVTQQTYKPLTANPVRLTGDHNRDLYSIEQNEPVHSHDLSSAWELNITRITME